MILHSTSAAPIADEVAAMTRATTRRRDRRTVRALQAAAAEQGMTPVIEQALRQIDTRWRVDPL